MTAATTSLHRHAFRLVAVLAIAGYAAIMAPLLRQDFQLATLGDTLALKLRDVDAQLAQDNLEIANAKKTHEDVSLLRDDRRLLNAQGQQAMREIQDWRARRALWDGIFWSVFALAHLVLLPLALWALAAAADAGSEARRSTKPATPRKRAPRVPKNTPPKLVEGAQP